jgi:uncharacterized membrane protein (UPF0127 family)
MYLSASASSSSFGSRLRLPSGRVVSAEVMRTPAELATGMQFRNGFPPSTVMLFLHPTAAAHRYHMRNVRIPLDLILMNSDGRVSGVTSLNLSDGNAITPRHSMAIEAPAGWARANNLKLGDLIRLG